MALYRCSRWDGTQAVEPFSPSDLMDELAEYVIVDYVKNRRRAA